MALIDPGRLTSIGVVTQPQGLKGELRVRLLTDVPEYYEEHRPPVILGTAQGMRQLTIRDVRRVGRDWVLALNGVETREAAEALQGANILLDRDHVKPLDEDEYFSDDLLGSRVRTLAGEVLGEVTGLLDIGPNEVLMVQGPRGEVLVPLVAGVVTAVDVATREILVDPPPGLLELNAPTGSADAEDAEAGMGPEDAPENPGKAGTKPGTKSGSGDRVPTGRRERRRR